MSLFRQIDRLFIERTAVEDPELPYIPSNSFHDLIMILTSKTSHLAKKQLKINVTHEFSPPASELLATESTITEENAKMKKKEMLKLTHLMNG